MATLQQTGTKSKDIFEHNRKYIPGGVMSLPRKVDPELAFERAEGAYMWDADGNRYLDYHAAFGPAILGHSDKHVNAAVEEVLKRGASLCGSGANSLEGQLAELMCKNMEVCELAQILNTGTEATMAAIRLARGFTGRDHVIVMQGGFNGSHNDVACNVMTPLEKIGPRVSPGEYKYIPLGVGVPLAHQQLVHPINFNDLESVRYVCERYPVAALITEPILQNVGILKPQPGYLKGLRELADKYGFVLIFDEVKTGFRYSVGGYSKLGGVKPDLAVFAKAMANGFPISALVGKRELMGQIADPNPAKRPFVAGTYNGHPVSVAAAIATIERLLEGNEEVYRNLEQLGQRMQTGVESILRARGITGVLARQGSAFCLYFMDHEPRDWHDLASNHDFARDLKMRLRLVEKGIYFFPVEVKQCSISAAHTEADIDLTLTALDESLRP
ncbi:MAG TPA: aspartate aminotransferase family protein [Terriglobales bacterium]|nr:aspartate aminotransferase family protein [Terriglobales bacterium]